MKHLVIMTLFWFTFSCSNIQLLNSGVDYSKDFLQKLESIQIIYKDGDKSLALKKLQNISDEKITKAERAKKYNFLGVIFFASGDINSATENFLIAKKYVDQDYSLESQINLNLASTYYKSNQIDVSQSVIKEVNLDYFNDQEKEKFYKLNLSLAKKTKNKTEIVNSLIFLMSDIERFEDIDDYQYKELLVDNYRELSSSERVYLLDKYQKKRRVVVAYLGKQEVLKRFSEGDKDGAKDVLSWIDKRYGKMEEVAKFIEDYKFRMENFSKINSGAVGVILPLSDDKKAAFFGKKAISGIMTAVGVLSKNDETLNIYLKDNKNNKYLARKMVQDLVLKHNVSVIIGGLFSDLAKEEYLEAKKYGVMYISLAEVYAKRIEKNHLLLEVPGSVESQIATVLKPENLNHFGKKMAVFYPFSDAGKSYINEFWGHHNAGNIELTGINHYIPKDKGNKYIDYRPSVKQLLSLRFAREREEELKVWKQIRSLDKSNFRVINELPPITDFDWVFIPSIPPEAIQILPTFPYFDAKNLKFVGGPSWINKRLMDEQQNLGSIFAIGNDVSKVSSNFEQIYRKKNKTSPKLIDTRAYVAMTIVHQLIKGQTFNAREDLEKRIFDIKQLKGFATSWRLIEGLWLKDMDILQISKRGFKKLEVSSN